MYILKNAIRGIVRSPGRTVIICLIVMVISAASCIAISIQQSAQTARMSGRDSLTIRGHIKADRKYVMETLQAAQENSTDGEADLETSLKAISGLDLDEMQTYAQNEAVSGFYYYATLSLSGDNGLKALNQDDHSEVEDALTNARPTVNTGRPGPGGPGGGGATQSIEDIMASINFGGDFVLYGYSSDQAMEDFRDGTCAVTAGSMFEQGTKQYECIINEELAAYNGLQAGDQISLCNPGMKSERFTFTVTGLYKNTDTSAATAVQSADDPANHILTSYEVVRDLTERSKTYRDPASVESLKTLEDGTVTEQLLADDGTLVVKGQEDAGDGYENEEALSETVVGTYLFATIEDYDAFENSVHGMGLSENYTVTSSDVAAYEASLVPLDNLSTYANTFLYIVLGIGALILIGVNVFNVRERKYEIGALTAMGMRKGKVALQFILELTIVTFLGIALGSCAGAVTSAPVANTLLASQIEYQQSNSEKVNENFGRQAGDPSAKPHGGDVEGEVEYVSAVSFTFDYEMLYRMAIIGAVLAFVSSAAAIGFVLRYNPLEILAERD